jgi:hypothetical protein
VARLKSSFKNSNSHVVVPRRVVDTTVPVR